MVTEAIVKFLKDNTHSNFFSSLLRQFERKGTLSERQLECVTRSMREAGLTVEESVPGAPVVAAPTPPPVSQLVRDYLEEKAKEGNWFFASLNRQVQARGYLSRSQQKSTDLAMEKDGFLFKEKLETFTLPVGEKIEINRGLANKMKKKLKMMVFFSNLEVVQVLNENEHGYRANVRFVSGVCTNCHCCGKDLDTEVSRASGIGPTCAKKYFSIKRATMDMAQKILDLLDKYCLEVGVIENVWIPKDKIHARLGQAHAPDSDVVAVRAVGDMVGDAGITERQAWEKAHKAAVNE